MHGHIGQHIGLRQVIEMVAIGLLAVPAEDVIEIDHGEGARHRLIGVAIPTHTGIELTGVPFARRAVVEQPAPMHATV